jgi:hypothetical protein
MLLVLKPDPQFNGAAGRLTGAFQGGVRAFAESSSIGPYAYHARGFVFPFDAGSLRGDGSGPRQRKAESGEASRETRRALRSGGPFVVARRLSRGILSAGAGV